MEIHIILFVLFTVVAPITMLAIGLAKRIPVVIAFGGLFMLVWSITTDTIIVDYVSDVQVTYNNVTDIITEDNEPDPVIVEFTELPKTIFAFFSVVLMLLGALISRID